MRILIALDADTKLVSAYLAGTCLRLHAVPFANDLAIVLRVE